MCRVTAWAVSDTRRTNRRVDRQCVTTFCALSFCGPLERWRARQCADESAPMVLETDIERSGIDRIQAGRAAAYTRQGVRDSCGSSAVVHVVADQFALEPVVCTEFPGPPQ